MTGAVLVIGVGNPLRGDDGVGREVARRVRAAAGPAVTVIEEEGDGARLLEAWAGAGTAILIDATASGAAPGTVRRFDATRQPLPGAAFRLSTHAFGLFDAIELARAIGGLPTALVVYGIEGEVFETGAPLSGAVAAA
ncbi:MAG TPA: hydrogenase maturation protease, partial [Vicinamibacterales bacterium]|nr:hydrogenase maturation protease [Vicinamibacterales bacterium]